DRPYARFLCMNSGSESVTVAARISDLHARGQTDPGGPNAGKHIKFLALQGAFHGRTDRPAQLSHSCMEKYKHLASFRDRDNLVVVPPNDETALRAAFSQATSEGVYFEAMFMEPVMGEGNPGQAVTPAFYRLARELTRAHGTLLVMDSIQAGIRATGCLSVVDYPGFETLDPPDMETYSKALNAGQYPLSVLAMTETASKLYETGIYGNTMTSNPRALEVACAVLDGITPELRTNIVERGHEMVERFEALAAELPGTIVKVQGTGLLMSAELDPDQFVVLGETCTEKFCRHHGLGVIHGGKNALRFTPHFRITSDEIELVVDLVRTALLKGPRKSD
ncbi:MAG: aminotransferase class III-fold pyridoxal phosphate-dependent enzyme, partial [Myxococcota bacterium]|nr:aminotransferase class III-fold pyridoxal phosphate-dependent enzyme [Myxococcota bacterium]